MDGLILPVRLAERARLAEEFGSEVDGAELSAAAMEPGGRAAIYAMLSERLVVIARNLILDASSAWKLFSVLFEPVEIAFFRGSPVAGTIIAVERSPTDEGWFLGGDWHTDMAYLQRPPDVSMLYGDVVPAGVGDTIFVDRRAPLPHLSEGLRAFLFDATCVQTAGKSFGPQGVYESGPQIGIPWELPDSLEAEQPCVLTGPGGASFISVDPSFTTRFGGWNSIESAGLLEFLNSFVTREEFQVRVHWEPGTLVLSANRLVAHRVMCDFRGRSRRLLRGNGYITPWSSAYGR